MSSIEWGFIQVFMICTCCILEGKIVKHYAFNKCSTLKRIPERILMMNRVIAALLLRGE